MNRCKTLCDVPPITTQRLMAHQPIHRLVAQETLCLSWYVPLHDHPFDGPLMLRNNFMPDQITLVTDESIGQ